MKLSSLSLVAAALAAIAGTTIASGPPHDHWHRGGPAHGEDPPAHSSEAPLYSGHPPVHSGPPHLQGGSPQRYGLPNPHTHRPDGPSQSYGPPNPHAHWQEPQGGLPHHDPPQLHGPSNPHDHGPPHAQNKIPGAFQNTADASAWHSLTAAEWGKAAKRAKRLTAEYGIRRESNIAYNRAKKNKIQHRERANVYSKDAITFSQTTPRDATKKERNRARNALAAMESCQTSFYDAQKSIRKSDEHLKRLGINFEAEEAARKKAKEARKKDEEARRGEAADGLLSLHRT